MVAEASWNGAGDITSEDEGEGAQVFDWFDDPRNQDPADIIEGEIVSEGSRKDQAKSGGSTGTLDRPAKGGVPNIDEWMHFFSKVVIRLSTDFYIDMAFRDVDENLLTDRDIERIKLTDTERDRMARPFAEYSNKSKFMRKHGRSIVSAADSIDAVIQIGMWVSRVNRIAARVKGKTGPRRPNVVRAAPVFRAPVQQEDNYEQETEGVSSFASPAQPGVGAFRPDIAGTVFNPGGGG